MKYISPFISLILTIWFSVEAADPVTSLYKKSLSLDDKPQSSSVVMAPGHELKYQVEITSKGNGTIQIGGLHIRSFDDHDDGMEFDGGSLTHQFIDVDGDGDLDLVVSGIAKFTEEAKQEAVLAVFIYDQLSRSLRQTVKNEQIYVFNQSS